MIVSTRALVEHAARVRGAVAAINVITLEHAEAIAQAAGQSQIAVIMQISENAVRFHGGVLEPIASAAAAVARRADVPIALHLDHVTDDDLLAQAPGSFFSSVMYDAGALPYDENVDRTRAATDLAHHAGLWVEAELGYVGGKAGAPQSAHAPGVRTDPAEAAAFVKATGVDALAVAVGSSHAMTTRSARVDVALIARLADRVPVPLVLHGASGVADDELRRAIEAGIAKVNYGTGLNVAMTSAIRSALDDDASLVDPRHYLGSARTAMTRTVADLLRVVGP